MSCTVGRVPRTGLGHAGAVLGRGDVALGGRGVGRRERWSQGAVEACKAAGRQALAYGSPLELRCCF